MDGVQNLWICKPAYNARGVGIYLTDGAALREEHANNTSNHAPVHSKIVQKYIERPLLIKHGGKDIKFDLRQWVLVTSFEPLKIYMFDEFYARLCSKSYNVSDETKWRDSYRHLTNYSIQRKSGGDDILVLQ